MLHHANEVSVFYSFFWSGMSFVLRKYLQPSMSILFETIFSHLPKKYTIYYFDKQTHWEIKKKLLKKWNLAKVLKSATTARCSPMRDILKCHFKAIKNSVP